MRNGSIHRGAELANDVGIIASDGSVKERRLAIVERQDTSTLTDWIAVHRDTFEQHMAAAGAVLFRRFPAATIGAFQELAPKLCGKIFAENPEHTPVTPDGAVQTPVAYAADRMLLWHNENSFNDEWPMRIAFCCVRPAEAGGETPIVDSCLMYREIDAEIRARFTANGIAYVRRFASGIGLDWQTVFRTGERAVVEEFCRSHQVIPEWNGGDLVQTRAIRPAVVAHPRTGEPSWFNQAQHWHPACLDGGVRDALESSVGAARLPRDCTFADGTPIPDADMHHILDVYRRNQVVFPWQPGDLLVLDNVIWAHARNPYRGRRTMLVAMGSIHRYDSGYPS